MSHKQHPQSKPTTEFSTVPAEHERRRATRGDPNGEPSRAQLVALILGTYREMPGLSVDLQQAARLFGLRETTCRVVMNDLVDRGRLHQSADGRYRSTPSGL